MRHAIDRVSAAEHAAIRPGDLSHSLLNAESWRAASPSAPWRPHPPGFGQRRETARPTVGPGPAISVVQERSW